MFWSPCSFFVVVMCGVSPDGRLVLRSEPQRILCPIKLLRLEHAGANRFVCSIPWIECRDPACLSAMPCFCSLSPWRETKAPLESAQVSGMARSIDNPYITIDVAEASSGRKLWLSESVGATNCSSPGLRLRSGVWAALRDWKKTAF